MARRLPVLTIAAALLLSIAVPLSAQDAADAPASETDAAPTPVRTQPRLVAFELEDQFKRTWTQDDYADRIVLAIATGRKSADLANEWGEAIAESFEAELADDRLAVLAVASLRGIPKFLRGAVVGRFPDREDRWVLMDWQGVFAEEYDLDTDVATLLLFDVEGNLLTLFPTEEVNATQVAILRAQVDDLIAQ